MNPSVNPVQQVDQAFIYIIGISFALLLAITVVMIYFVIRYHHRRNPNPSDIRGNWKLELIWTLVPTLIALSMFAVGWNAYTGLRAAPADAMEVEVIAQKFSYVFIYPDGKESEDELVVPVGRAVKLRITSDDVLHGVFIPAYRVKVDAVPGLDTFAWFQADKTGKYDILCTEYCGTGHADMTAILEVVPEDEFRQWLETDEEEDDDESEDDTDEESAEDETDDSEDG